MTYPAEGQRRDDQFSAFVLLTSPRCCSRRQRGQQWHPQLMICQLRRPPAGRADHPLL